MDRFSEILYDLGKEIGVDLYPDENRICQLNYDGKLHLQIQYDETKDLLLFASFLIEVPAGKYRETLFKEALKSNAQYPRIGTLAYSGRNNQLTLFAYYPRKEHSIIKVFEFLKQFIDKGVAWKEAVAQGGTLPSSSESAPPRGGMFGLKP